MEDRKFNPEHLDRLNDPARLERLDPRKIVEFSGMENPQKIVDIGAGTAFITSAISELVPDASIDAFDIEPVMVDAMRKSLPAGSRIKPYLMTDNRLPLGEETADWVMMINLYHELKKPFLMLKEVKRVLKTGGKVLIIDWARRPDVSETGPPLEHRVEEATITSHLIGADFFNIKTTETFPDHLGVIARK